MQRGRFLDVVVDQRTTVFELLSSKNQPLLVRRDPFLVLDLRLHIVDCVHRADDQDDLEE